MNSLVDLFSEIFDTKDIEDIFNNSTIKIQRNGTPIVDIENGVDKLKTVVKENEAENKCSENTCYKGEVDIKNPSEEEFPFIANGITMIGNTYLLTNSVDGTPVMNSTTEITFDEETEDGCYIGVTERQLLDLLRYRFRNIPEYVELIDRF